MQNSVLFSVRDFKFKSSHLLIIGILVISFSISFMVRSQAADYGFELNEFDPFFNYRATKFIVDNGFDSYFQWHDDRSWYPQGRDISRTSQVMLHVTAAALYQIFGGNSNLYEFTILFPVVFGSLTTIVIFALVRVIGGTTAGLFSALFFSVSVPVIVRGTVGWFKSEPLGLFYGLLGIYLFISGLKSENQKIAVLKLIGGGVILTLGISAWGGIQFFIIPLSFFFLGLPFLRNDHRFVAWAIPLFTTSFILSSLGFERLGFNFATGLSGFVIIASTIVLLICVIIQKFSKEETKTRNGLLFLAAAIIIGIFIIAINDSLDLINTPSFRYLNAINPFLTTTDPLVDSVSEHATTTTSQSFFFSSILMIFAAIGIWLLFKKKDQSKTWHNIHNDMLTFALIIGLSGVYVTSAFIRLELFASISVIILSSLGLSILISEIFRRKKEKKGWFELSKKNKISYLTIIIILLLLPTTLPANANWITGIKSPPTILNGGTIFNMATNDWLDAMKWLRENTPQDAVVASWWDYGYWITVLGERISLADNATLSTERIQDIAQMLLSPPDEAWEALRELDADYVLIYIASQKVATDPNELYILKGGADESKKQWFIAIAEEPFSKYLQSDGFTGTDYFWENTLLGKMIPYSIVTYADIDAQLQSETYRPGFTALYVKDIKYPSDGNGPLKLVYSSPSFDRKKHGPISGVFIYEVNKNYDKEEFHSSQTIVTEEAEVGVISTSYGDIVIDFKENVAPKTVENFKKLATSGFYNGTIFHRIISGFVIQGGDPNTISDSRDTWGLGGPGYTIEPEFSNLKHKKYIVSMARGEDINSAGSQFFIMLDDAPWLDGKYTIFGEVISGQEIVDKIGSLETNEKDQPINPDDARIISIKITKQ